MYFRQRIDLLWGRQRVFVVIQSTSVWPRFAQPCAQNQNRCINSLNVAWTAGKFSRVHFDSFFVNHSMATANLKKSEDLVTNTTAASKYIPRRPKISINWNPTFQTFFFEVNFQKWKFPKLFGSLLNFFCFTIHKKLNKSCSLEKKILFLKKNFVSLRKNSFEILSSEVRKAGLRSFK